MYLQAFILCEAQVRLVPLRFEQWERGSARGYLGICPDITPAVSKPNSVVHLGQTIMLYLSQWCDGVQRHCMGVWSKLWEYKKEVDFFFLNFD